MTPFDLSRFVVIDCDSGTFFGANTAFLLDTTRLSEDELDILDEGRSDDRSHLAGTYGHELESLIDPSTLTYSEDGDSFIRIFEPETTDD